MKRAWAFFSSTTLTVALAVLICLAAAWGSVLAVKNPNFYRAVDQVVLLPWLLSEGVKAPGLTLWILALVALAAVFALNTVVCTLDRVYSVIRHKRPYQLLFPHIVHAGFLVALLGHLVGSVTGFRSPGNVLFKGAVTPVAEADGISVRLEDYVLKTTPRGDPEELRSTVTIFRDGTPVRTGDIEINSPLVYEGVAFYHVDQGRAPAGLILDVDGERKEVRFDNSFTAGGREWRLSEIYPDFAMDESGRPYSRSRAFRNPHIEIVSGGRSFYLDISAPGSSVSADGKTVRLVDYVISPYVVLSIHKDPGIWFIIAGSIILVAGMVALLFMRGERSEIVRKAP